MKFRYYEDIFGYVKTINEKIENILKIESVEYFLIF